MILHLSNRTVQVGENDSRHGARRTQDLLFLGHNPIVSAARITQARNCQVERPVRALYAAKQKFAREPDRMRHSGTRS
jgi:hypothetical protein